MEDPMKIKSKICLLGDFSVGKTSLIRRFVKNIFDERYVPTLGTRTSKKNLIIKNPKLQKDLHLTLIIWDIMGQYSFRKLLHPAYLKGADGAILVSDQTRRITLEHLDNWIDSLYEEADIMPTVFIANKNDLSEEFEFGKTELDDVASDYESPFFITSAKTGENVEEAFKILGEKIISNMVEKDGLN